MVHSRLVTHSSAFSDAVPNSAWKPLKGPVRDWPLALCDASTITPSTDFEAADTVYEKRGPDENYQIYYRPEHQWFYLSEQDVSEILLFRQYDSDLGAGSGKSHFLSMCAHRNSVNTHHRCSSCCHPKPYTLPTSRTKRKH